MVAIACRTLSNPPHRRHRQRPRPQVTPDDLASLIAGLPTIDVDDWERHSLYSGGLTAECDAVRWFWRAARRLAPDERALLLQFGTGSRHAPIGGFAFLEVRRSSNSIRIFVFDRRSSSLQLTAGRWCAVAFGSDYAQTQLCRAPYWRADGLGALCCVVLLSSLLRRCHYHCGGSSSVTSVTTRGLQRRAPPVHAGQGGRERAAGAADRARVHLHRLSARVRVGRPPRGSVSVPRHSLRFQMRSTSPSSSHAAARRIVHVHHT